MNQINPLHIGALLVAILAFLLFTLSGVKDELRDEKKLFAQSEKLAIELSGLKDVYASKQKTQSAIERLLAQGPLKDTKFEVKKEKNSIKIAAASIDTNVLNALMGKVLNGSYHLQELKIKKLSETKASLEMEIKW